MKVCPRCGRHYETTQVFCNADGATLIYATNTAVAEPKNDLWLIYLMLGSLALVLGAGISGWFWMRSSRQANAETVTEKSVVENKDAISRQPNPTDKAIDILTAEAVQNLLKRWEKAQDARDFETYRNCYDRSFKGVKTMLKGSQEYNYEQWVKDRRLMFAKAVGLDVDVKNLQISIDGETATAEFDQYYRSLSYSDWGAKVLKVKQTTDGAKITYELMKESNPL